MKYQEELQSFIELIGDTPQLPTYFTTEFLDFLQSEHGEGKAQVGIIGDNYYSLFVKAYGLKPVLLSGGSYFTGDNTDMFPQISDPVAKSALGLLLDPEYKLYETLAAVVVVALNDSYKKSIAYLKEMGITVIQVEPIPYIREGTPFALYKQQLSALNDISKVKFSLFSSSIFTKELQSYQRGYELLQEDACRALPTLVQAFFTHLLHNVWDKDEFCDQLEQYLEGRDTKIPPYQVTLLGSIISLPNRKVFQIFNDIGITHFDNRCDRLPNFGSLDLSGGGLSQMMQCFNFQHTNAFLPGTVAEVQDIILPRDSGGVIYYLLKGQTSEAYQAERLEELAIDQDVPYLCVETDYTYTDSEQMKIRIEAFYEMLSATAKKQAALAT